MICYEKLADHFFNVYFSGSKWLELVSKVSGTLDLSCTGIELYFFLSAALGGKPPALLLKTIRI